MVDLFVWVKMLTRSQLVADHHNLSQCNVLEEAKRQLCEQHILLQRTQHRMRHWLCYLALLHAQAS